MKRSKHHESCSEFAKLASFCSAASAIFGIVAASMFRSGHPMWALVFAVEAVVYAAMSYWICGHVGLHSQLRERDAIETYRATRKE